MKPLTSLGWRNKQRYLYTQFCYVHEIDNPKLQALIERFGKAFDDEYCYEMRGRSVKIVHKTPIWLGFREPTQQFWREKYFPPKNGQRKLDEP